MKRIEKTIAIAYQIAGQRLLAEDLLTKGQKERLTTLLLDLLAEPDTYPSAIWRQLYRQAIEP